MLQSLTHFCGSSQKSFQDINVSFVLGSPELNPASQMCLTNAEQKGTAQRFLTLLPMLCLWQPRMLLTAFAVWVPC